MRLPQRFRSRKANQERRNRNRRVTAQFEDAAKKYGFRRLCRLRQRQSRRSASYSAGSIRRPRLMSAQKAMMKQQIAEVQADKKMPAKEKKAALDEMNAMLKSPPPAIQNKGNIDLVAKYYDKLAALLNDSQ